MTIELINTPNQTLTVRLNNASLFISLQTHNGILYASTSINGEAVANGVRCVNGSRITPRSSDRAIGGFLVFKTANGSYPSYEDFGIGCSLEYEARNV